MLPANLSRRIMYDADDTQGGPEMLTKILCKRGRRFEVQLNAGQGACFNSLCDFLERGVYEHANLLDLSGQVWHDRGDSIHRYLPRAGCEDEANGIGASFCREKCIFSRSVPADFDP